MVRMMMMEADPPCLSPQEARGQAEAGREEAGTLRQELGDSERRVGTLERQLEQLSAEAEGLRRYRLAGWLSQALSICPKLHLSVQSFVCLS